MKPFNLQEALAGKPAVTREGKVARDFHVFTGVVEYQRVFAAVGDEVMSFNEEGRFWNSGAVARNDLFMASEKKEGWIAFGQHRGCGQAQAFVTHAWATEEEAKGWFRMGTGGHDPVGTVKISWEE
jgi:hypothetical protein